jgi:hypothetical protein
VLKSTVLRILHLLWVALYRSSTTLSRLGERFDVPWLVYNPLLFVWYHGEATRAAPIFFRAVQEVFPSARRYVDVGAGTGATAARGRRLGLDVEACEYSAVARWFSRAQGVASVPFDLARNPPAALRQDFDIAYSLEVGEHVAPSLSRSLAAFLVGSAPCVIFTAAQPGQGGHGHINEQPRSYWIELFKQQGVHHRPDLTEAIRTALRHGAQRPRSSTDWLIDNMMVFMRDNAVDS